MEHDPLALHQRRALPDEYLILLRDFPRADWPDHANFNGLAAFWLHRHLDFRTMMAQMRSDAQMRLDSKVEGRDYAQRLQRIGSRFLGELVGHHQIEDTAYFPKLAALEPRIARGFDLLDSDHHALHAQIGSFTDAANTLLQAATDPAQREEVGSFLPLLTQFETLLGQHLNDEEDLVLPVVLKHRIE